MHFHKTPTGGFSASAVLVILLTLLGRAGAINTNAQTGCSAGTFLYSRNIGCSSGGSCSGYDGYYCSVPHGKSHESSITQNSWQQKLSNGNNQLYTCANNCRNSYGAATYWGLRSYRSNSNSNYQHYCICFEASPTCTLDGPHDNPYSGNTYYGLTQITLTCNGCTSGKYQPNNNVGSGTFCTTKTGPTSCNAGSGYAEGGNTADRTCTACGTGFYQPNDGSTSVCTAHSHSSCPAGQYYTAGSTTTDSTCTPCPSGTAKAGTSTVTSCSACSSGTFSLGGAATCTAWSTCPVGQSYTAGSSSSDSTCTPCGTNEYSSGGTTTQCTAKTVFSCPTGQGFTDGENSTDNSCAACVAGTANLGVNADACEACAVGTFSASGASQCTPWVTKTCPAGQQLTDEGREADASCQPCPTGTYKQGTNADQCAVCPAGSEVTPVGQSSAATGCQLCTRASHWDSSGTSVVGCETVSFCAAGESMIHTSPDQNSLCHACAAGTYQGVENSTATSCQACPSDTFSLAGADSCTAHKTECPAGFQLSALADSIKSTHDRHCEVCPAGMFKASSGSASCAAHATPSCPAGEEARGTSTADATCQACPAGTFKASAGTDMCAAHKAPCDAILQTESTAPSATEDRVCANKYVYADATTCCAEWQDANGDCQLYKTECSPGHALQDDGGVASDKTCQACASGHFKAGTNADACTGHRTTCPEGTELNQNGDSTKDHACDPCQAGDFKAGDNANQCATCGGGTWTSDNIQCVAHTVCDATTEVQLAAGTTSSDTVCGCAADHHSDNGTCTSCDSVVVSTIAGSGSQGSTDGTGTGASLFSPDNIASIGTDLYLIANNQHQIRKIDTATNVVTTIAGSGSSGSTDGVGSAATFEVPSAGVGIGTDLYVVDRGNFIIRKIDTSTNTVTTVAGTAGVSGSTDGIGTAASFGDMIGITAIGTDLYLTDKGNKLIRKIDTTTSAVTTIAGSGSSGSTDGIGSAASFQYPFGITAIGTDLYVADFSNNLIRKIDTTTNAVTTIAGSGNSGTADGIGSQASFDYPRYIHALGTDLYVTSNSQSIRKINTLTNEVTTFIGSGGNIHTPRGLTAIGSSLYVADSHHHLIHKVAINTGTRLAGDSKLNASACCSGGYQTSATEACTAYSEDAASCNAQRKPFVAGDASTDASCGPACNSTTEYASGSTCVAYKTSCPAGQQLSTTLTPAVDLECLACPQGTYKEASGGEACAVCAQGNEIIPLDATEGGTGCSPCDKTQEFDADGSHTACVATEAHCDKGFYFHETAVEQPNTCTPCDSGTYQPLDDTTNACVAWTVCLGTEIEAISPTSSRDRVCACAADHHLDGNGVCQACGAGETRLAGDAKDEAATTCCANSYQLAAKGACQAATDCDATSELVKTALTASSDRVCECAENYRYDGSGACQACTGSDTRLAGDAKVGASKACCSAGFQASAGGSCTAWITTCQDNYELTGGTASAQKTCVACASTKQSTGGAACKTFAERHYSSSKPTTKAGIETALSNSKANYRTSSVKNTRMDFRSMIKFMKTEIAALTGRRVKLNKSKMVMTSKFSASLGSRTEVEVVVPKSKTKLDQADACTEKDIDLSSQTDAYDVSLEEGEVSLICTGSTPMTKLRFEQDSNLHTGVTDDTYKYSCWTGSAWDTEVSVTVGDDYQCGSNTYYVNSHSGVTCTATAPVSSLDSAVVAGTNNCGTVGEGHACTDYACNANFVLQTAPNCTSAGYTPAVCHCPANFYEDGAGQCLPHSTEAQLGCNAQRKKYVLGTATANAVCGATCSASEYASGEVCVPYSTDEATCSAARKTYQAGGNDVDASCPALCLETQYVSGNQCLDLLTQCADGKELTGGSNTTNRVCIACASGEYKVGTNADSCQACPAGSEIIPIGATSEGTGCEVCTVAHEYDHDNNAVTGCLTTNSTCDNSYQILVTSGTQLNLCLPCASGTFQPDDATTNQCQAHTVVDCGDGEELTTAPNAMRDGVCTPCAGGKYKIGTNTDVCVEHSNCPIGEGKTANGTASTNTQCAACSGWSLSDWELVTSGTNANSVDEPTCKAYYDTRSSGGYYSTVTTGWAGHGNFPSGCWLYNNDVYYQTTGRADDSCSSVQCVQGSASTFSDTDDKSVCQAHATCAVGEGLLVAGNSTHNTVCAPCGAGTFSSVDDKSTCQAHANCPIGEGKTVDGTASANTQCAACGAGFYSSVDDKSACQAHGNCPIGEGKTLDGTASANTQCAACGAGFFSSVDDKSACQAHSNCPVGEGKTVDGTASANTQCAACGAGFYSDTNDKSACQAYSTCPAGKGQTSAGNATSDTVCSDCAAEFYSSTDDNTACQTCNACVAGQVETTACSSLQNRVCAAGQCTSMPAFANEANADGQGTCTGTLTHGQTCQLSCDAGHHPATYTCDTETLNAPATACMVCEAYEHSDGDSHCATDAAYTTCQCTNTTCTEAVSIDKYFVLGNSDNDDSQCLDATIKQASDCPDGSEFTSANTGTANGVCTPCGANEFSTGGAACQAHTPCGNQLDTSPRLSGATATTAGVCDACANGTYAATGAETCAAHSDCPVGQGKTADGTASANTQCTACSGWASSDWQLVTSGNNDNSVDEDGCKAYRAQLQPVPSYYGSDYQGGYSNGGFPDGCFVHTSGVYYNAGGGQPCSAGAQCVQPSASTFSDTNDKSACQAHATCAVGEGKTLDGTASANTQCAACGAGFYSDANDKSACQAHSSCPVGEGKTVDGTASANTQCATCGAGTFSSVDDKSACQAHATCPVGQGKTADGTASANTQCAVCGNDLYSSVDDKSACQTCTACVAGQVETTACTSSQNRVCAAGQCTSMPAFANEANADGQGTCTGTLTHGQTCQLSCDAGHHPATYTCDTETLNAPATACMVCEAYEHSDGDSHCATDAAYTTCQCLSAACTEAVAIDKYFVVGNSDNDDSQCLVATIKQASDCPDGSEFTSANTGTANGVCTPCGANEYSTNGATCQAHTSCGNQLDTSPRLSGATATTAGVCDACANGTYAATGAETCTPCGADQFSSGGAACQAHSTCPVGEGKTLDGTASTDTQCAACGAGFFSSVDDKSACQAHSPCASGKGVLTAGTSTTDTACEDCVDGTSYSETASTTETCQACAGTCLEEEAIACTASQNRVCGTLQACTMPAHTSKSNTDSAGDCLAQLASSTSCSFSCTGGYSAATYSCYNGTLTEPAEACLACQLYEHSDGDAATCATDAAYTTCGCNSAACPEATGSQKYFVAGNSNADDSQCLDLTITQASDCADGSEFTAPTGTSNGVCTPCAAGSFSTGGAACQGHATQCPNPQTEYISQAGSLVADIQCSALLVCGATQLETAAPSTNAAGAFVTNRQCGCLATEEISGDKCLCKADHYVSGGACKNCSVGYSRAAGDEKTGGDTTCSESVCTSFPAQASVAFTTAVGSCSGSLAHGGSCSYTCAAGFQAQSYTCDKGVLTAPEIACLCPAQQHESGGACVDDNAYTNCGCQSTTCPESPANKFFSIGMQDNLDSSECRVPSFTEEKLGTAARPTTETAIAAVIDNFKPSYIDAASNSAASAATKKEQFKSVITYSRREIAKLPQRRVAIDKASMVVSQEFLDSVPAGKKVDIVIPKTKTPATLANLATACTEKDIQLSGQDNAYDVALEEGDTSLICHGTTAKTKLKRDANGYKYSCVDGNAWTAETSISEDSSYTCPEGGKYFVNSHSGTTCAVEPPVSQSFPSITAGTSGSDCGTHIGENSTCSYECNSNFLKVSGPSCSSSGVFTRAVCSCVHDGFVDNAMGSCEGCASGTFSTGGQACQPWTVTEASCNTQNKVFVAGTHSTDSSCGITCAGGLIADGALCKEPSTAVSCASLQWMYFSDTCCDGVDRAISCMASLTEQKIKIVDSLATLKQDSGADCTDGMEVSFKAGKIVCR